MPALGLLDDALANNAEGSATVLGIIGGIDTSSYAINDELYVSTTAGVLTATRPTGASELVQKIGRVVRVDASTGEILVLGSGRANDVPNGALSNDTTGNAATATALETARTINGVSFDGTANITVAAAAGTLTGATLASGVTASSLTSVGTLSALSVGGNITVTGTVDGRDVAADGTKLDGIESGADVTDAANVETAIEAITLTSVAGATGDEILVVDATDGGLKAVLWQNLPGGAVDSVNSQTGTVVLDADDISDTATTNKFTTAADITKLAGIESGATADQTAADIRGLGFFDTTNDGTGSGLDADLLDGNHATAFATAAQGATADSALQNVVEDTTPQLGGSLDVNGQEITGAIDLHSTGDVITELGDAAGVNKLSVRDSAAVEVAAFDSDGNLTLSGTVDGRDVAADGTKLDGIAAGAEVNAVDSVNSQTGVVVLDADDISDAATTNKFTTAADITKLAGIETGADVTDAANVETSIEAITLTAVAGATGDEVLIVDATDGGLKAVLWENLPSSSGVTSSDVNDIVEISQASYTALGAGRPANRLYLITS
jgi:hypothetical protein